MRFPCKKKPLCSLQFTLRQVLTTKKSCWICLSNTLNLSQTLWIGGYPDPVGDSNNPSASGIRYLFLE